MFDFGSWRKFLVIFFFEGVFWTVDCDKAGFPPVWIINGIQTSLTFKESCSIRGERIDGSSSFSAKISKEKGWGKEWESKRRCSWHGNLAPNVPASWSPISLYLSNSVSVFTSRFSRGVATAWRAGYQGIGRRYHLGYPSGGEWARLLKGPIWPPTVTWPEDDTASPIERVGLILRDTSVIFPTFNFINYLLKLFSPRIIAPSLRGIFEKLTLSNVTISFCSSRSNFIPIFFRSNSNLHSDDSPWGSIIFLMNE